MTWGLAASPADDAAPQPPSVERLVTRLGDADWSVREEATYALMDHEGVDDTVLTAAFRAARTAEERHRLARVALHRYYLRLYRQETPATPDPESPGLQPTAAIGVDLRYDAARIVQPYQNPLLPNPAVLINGSMPGFPAFARLRPGDLVVAVGGQPFDDKLDINTFIDRIKTYAPGQEMTLRVLRDGRLVDVTLVTDSKRRLDHIYLEPKDVAWAANQPQFRAYLQTLSAPAAEAPKVEVHFTSEADAEPAGASPRS